MADQEIEALAKVAAALDTLDDPARRRVIEWAANRFGIALVSKSPAVVHHREDDPGSSAASGQLGNTSQSLTGFDSLAELFDAAQPKTDAERALVGAYWITTSSGQPDFQAQPVNTQLKDLGYAVGNITDALTALKDRKPALVLQMKKEGTSRQARKTYRLTQAGKKRVQAMLTGAPEGEDE